MNRTIARLSIIAIALAWAAVLGAPAQASSVSSLSVYECQSTCTAVSSGATVNGNLQIKSTVNGQYLRIDAIQSGGPTVCLGYTSTQSLTVNWDSRSFPTTKPSSSCPSSSYYGAPTANTTYTIRVSTQDLLGSSSKTFNIVLNNAPSAPIWASDPSVSGTAERQPAVRLQWSKAPETDVKEYRITRTNPGGSAPTVFAVSATQATQGCSSDSGTFTCYDTAFPSNGFGGTYGYSIVSYRSSSSSSTTCSDGSKCIASDPSSTKQVSMTEPPPPSPSSSPTGAPPQQSSGGPSGGVTGGSITPVGVPSASSSNSRDQQPTHVLGESLDPSDCFTCGTYKKTLPYGSQQQYSTMPGDSQGGTLAAGSTVGTTSGTDPRQLWVSVAAGLVLLLTAGHVARVLRTTAH